LTGVSKDLRRKNSIRMDLLQNLNSSKFDEMNAIRFERQLGIIIIEQAQERYQFLKQKYLDLSAKSWLSTNPCYRFGSRFSFGNNKCHPIKFDSSEAKASWSYWRWWWPFVVTRQWNGTQVHVRSGWCRYVILNEEVSDIQMLHASRSQSEDVLDSRKKSGAAGLLAFTCILCVLRILWMYPSIVISHLFRNLHFGCSHIVLWEVLPRWCQR
jgi:hypothetical protein